MALGRWMMNGREEEDLLQDAAGCTLEACATQLEACATQ